ncbi:hypothetical protein ACFO0S_11290 [Chryseomicrobium palamuruense]|uniref:Uncharacterized protein n=1 Tax=Chryseomicrobium palamuruense TaxID=682973 RepID=A0ABV8UWE5_9BACL
MAETTGDEEWANKFAEEETKFKLLLSSKEKYDKGQQFLAAGEGSELEKRQLELLVNEMKSNQLPEEVIADLAKRGADLNCSATSRPRFHLISLPRKLATCTSTISSNPPLFTTGMRRLSASRVRS